MTILTEMAKIKLICCCLLLLPPTFSATTTDDGQLFFSSTATAPNNFHWHSLFNTSNDNHFADLFLPPYLSFDKLILQTHPELNTSTLSYHHQLSQPCQRSLQQALEALANRQSWAVELFNAWAQAYPPTGAASGTLSDLGDFDQCLDLVSSKMSTKYCLLDYHFPMPRPRPKHHNFYHQTPNLLPSLENEQDYQLKSRSSFYRKLEQVSPLLYYTSIQIAICLPTTCSSEDVFFVGSKGLNFLLSR